MKIPAQISVNPESFTFTRRAMCVPNDMTPEDLALPANWSNLYQKVAEGDEIVVWPQDRRWRLWLLVREKGIGYVRTSVIQRMDFEGSKTAKAEPEEEIPVPEGYTVNFAPRQHWRVMINDPHEVISKDHKTKNEAIRAAIAHAAKANAVAA
jgi:hypothetical protein